MIIIIISVIITIIILLNPKVVAHDRVNFLWRVHSKRLLMYNAKSSSIRGATLSSAW